MPKMLTRRGIKSKNRWSQAQLELLVDVWEKYYSDLKSGRGNDEIYELMVHEMHAVGFNEATEKDIRCRINNLSGKYRKEANTVFETGKPSKWTLYKKIGKFYDYETPVQYKVGFGTVSGGTVYDMSEDLDMDLAIDEALEMNSNNTHNFNSLIDYDLVENLQDIDELVELDEELLAGEQQNLPVLKHYSGDVLDPQQQQQSTTIKEQSEGNGHKANNTNSESAPHHEPVQERKHNSRQETDEEPAKLGDRKRKEKAAPEVKPEKEADVETSSKANGNGSESNDSADTNSDSSIDFKVPPSVQSATSQSSQVFHFKGSYRHAAIENFLSQLYSNQLYADVMLITCHEGITCVMPAHRMVLANFSEFFSSMLGALKPGSNGSPLTVLLQPEISQPVMQLLLQFMYTGKVSVKEDLIGDFLRCGYLLRIRGVWSEEKRDAMSDSKGSSRTSHELQQPSSDGEESPQDEPEDRSSVSNSVRQSTRTDALQSKSSDSSYSPSSSEASEDSTMTYERPKKRRKKAKKDENRISFGSDAEVEDIEVSSKVGFDLLRSDSEMAASERNGRNQHAQEKDAGEESEDAISVDNDENYDDGDDDEDYVKGEEEDDDFDESIDSMEDEEEGDDYDEDDEEFDDDRPLYIDTGDDDDAVTDFERNSIVNGSSMGNPSTVTTPEPRILSPPLPPPPAPPQHKTIDNSTLHRIDRLKRRHSTYNPIIRIDRGIEEVPRIVKKEQLEKECVKVPIEPLPPAPLPSTKAQELRRALQTIPSSTTVQQITQRQQLTNRMTRRQSHPAPSTEPCIEVKQSTTSNSSSINNKQIIPKTAFRTWYGCKICRRRFKVPDDWLEHVVYEHASDETCMNGEKNPDARQITLIQCDLCCKFLSSKYEWLQHIVKRHTERYPHLHEELGMSDE